MTSKNKLIIEDHNNEQGTKCEAPNYCQHCERVLSKKYPQGWRYYAGDVCKHGAYVGGCGIDNMCIKCELE